MPSPSSPVGLPRLIHAAMDLERRTMHLYCQFENQFGRPEELRRFWFDMAQHESRHFGALALVSGLLQSLPRRGLPRATALTPTRVQHLRRLLARFHREVAGGVALARAFEISLEIESSEIEDVVLALLRSLRGADEHARAMQLLIHDLGDLSYMIEKYTTDHALLARADALLESQVGQLRPKPTKPRSRSRRAER